MLEAVKVWPGKGEACRKIGATANLDSFCAHRPQRCAGRDEETDFEIKSRNRRRKRCAALANSLTKKAPYKGLGAESEEKQEPASDIDTGLVDGLKVLDPERPIREAAVSNRSKAGLIRSPRRRAAEETKARRARAP